MVHQLKERFDFWTILSLFIFIMIMILCVGEWLSGKKDGQFEELAEDMIHHHTGLEIDLSTYTPESYYD